ncbi:helix-turn-helix domain-containing protein [Xanthomonas campestris]|uniref:helix-turn-helix domain-containing protein n=1 Tax=Xanthomonas campestris TaxID=339 RepID=UPI001E344CEE|nr:helix-turn-helix domain-containing protein [Xanthomonas campestris]MCC5067062.1 helix-turn-helix domain-containing protein [Xanthomonas campestris]
MDEKNKLLDKARVSCKCESDGALARRMGVTRAAVSSWRHGQRMDDKNLAALLELAGEHPRVAIFIKNEDAETAAEKAVWGELTRRLLRNNSIHEQHDDAEQVAG